VGVQVSPVDTAIRRTTTASVVLLAGIAAIVSYRHMHTLALQHGETVWTAALIPLSVDGMIVASSMSLLLDSRRGTRSGHLPWALLMIGSTASLAANVAVAEPTLYGRVIAAWPSLALIGAYELLMRQIRLNTADAGTTGSEPGAVQQSPVKTTIGAARGSSGAAPAAGPVARLGGVRSGSPAADGDLLREALRLDAENWTRHRRPVSAETLRTQLGIGMARARQLRDQIRSAHRSPHVPAVG
jgi:hypothetical protein